MALIIALLVGAVVGAIGGYMLQDSFDLLAMNIVLGIAGALLGYGIHFFTLSDGEMVFFSWQAILFEALGAGIFVFLLSFLNRKAPKAL